MIPKRPGTWVLSAFVFLDTTPTALGPVANTDTKLLIYGLFQKGRVLAQDAVRGIGVTLDELGNPLSVRAANGRVCTNCGR